MPATDPFTYNVPKKVSDSELARALRLDAMAEFDAINLYSAHMDSTENEDARKVLAFVMRDEKEHFALFAALIRRLDPDQGDKMQDADPKLDAIFSLPLGASEAEVDKATEKVSRSRP